MDYNTFEKVLFKMRNNGALGNDLISTYWIKKLTSTRKPLVVTLIWYMNKMVPFQNG